MLRRLTGVSGVVCAVAVASLMGGACARADDGGSGSQDRLTACELHTPAEVTSALGGPTRAPAGTDEVGADVLAGRSGCAWATRDDRGAALVELVRTDDMSDAVRRTGFSATARFNGARSRNPAADGVDVGERAFWVDEDARLYVLVARSYLVIEVATPGGRAPEDVAMTLAEAAVRRLSEADGAD